MKIPKNIENKVKKLSKSLEENNKVVFAVLSKRKDEYELLCTFFGNQMGVDQYKERLEDIDFSFIDEDTQVLVNDLLFTEEENKYIEEQLELAREGKL